VHSDGNADFHLNRVTLRITYDYVPGASSLQWPQYRDAQNQQIGAFYGTLLQRPASVEELSAARNLLDVGYTSAQLFESLSGQHHHEVLERRARALYQSVLHRAATGPESGWASAELDQGRPEAEVAEFIQIITDAIQDSYGRDPSYDELVSFTELLDAGWL
jgi:hypothetical protein